MLNRLDLRGVADPTADLPRPHLTGDAPVAAVRSILDEVRVGGDAALRELTARFDGVTLETIAVPEAVLAAALDAVGPDLRAALELARDRIATHHRAQLRPPVVHDEGGIRISSSFVPVDRVGCYVPGGRAPLPSTLLMTAVPALVAGVAEVVVCAPPDREAGGINPVTLAAAAVAGVTEVYAVGGAQAIGAMAYGTESIAPVDVVCGPGNIYVAIAKQEVAGRVGVAAAFAGPSEVVVVADDTVDPRLAALDVVLQAEHGPDGLAWLICWESAVADAVGAEVARIVASSPRRAEITATLAEGGYAVVCDSPEQAMAVSNAIAPEHLELLVADPSALVPLVRNAGAVFCGAWSPASVGDYLAGPSHVLPTHGTARFASALTVDDFLKHHHIVEVSPAGLAAVGPQVATLADAEGLAAHAESVRARLRQLDLDTGRGA